MTRYVIERNASRVAGLGKKLGQAGTFKAAMKAVRRLSRGGEDRDVIATDEETGAVVFSGADLDADCQCGHARQLHKKCRVMHRITHRVYDVRKCSVLKCSCVDYRKPQSRDKVEAIGVKIESPYEEHVPQGGEAKHGSIVSLEQAIQGK